jgi:hypothetical protein
MEILGVQLGLTIASQDLRTQIEAAGWSVSKVGFDSKRDKYEAIAQSPNGGEVKQYGRTERLALSNLLLAVTRRSGRRSFRLGRWRTTFTEQLAEIAQAYAKAPLYEAKASASFMELARDCERRAEVLGQHLAIQIVNDPNPYKDAEALVKDVKKSRQLKISRAGADHPIWSQDQVIAYRICHDVLGYVAADAGWDWYGENEAFAAHVAMVPHEAQKALFTESIATTAYASYYQAYGPEKVVVLSQFVVPAMEKESPGKFPGVHPSQSFPAVAVPSVEHKVESSAQERDRVAQIASQSLLDGLDQPHEIFVRTAAAPQYYLDPNRLQDPNYGYTSGEEPMLTNNGQTIAQAYGDPLQIPQAQENAAKIIPRHPDVDVGTEWAYLNRENPNEVAVMKKAIVNAFRVVLLSPRKDLMWNAIHYQHISDVPGDEDRPEVYWNTLENARRDWNEARGYDRFSHIPYMKHIPALINVMYQKDPEAGYDQARLRAQWLLYNWGVEIENKLMKDDADKPEEERRASFQIETKANYVMEQRLKMYLKEAQPKLDKAMTRDVKKYWREDSQSDPGNEMGDYYRHAGVSVMPETGAPEAPDNQDWMQQPDKRKYGAFMGGHLKAIANVSRHVDGILEAALEDVHEHNGAGWHFRAYVLQLGISGVGPKVCSFAWLLLQPMTSELATIDTHILDVLGIHNEKQYNNRDYFGYERAFRARMDAAGYSHVPLGQAQWAMWDYKRTGPGSHQDHSAMRVLNPVPHENIDWAAKEQPINAEQAAAFKKQWFTGNHPDAEWWNHTQEAGQDAWNDWQKTMAPEVGKAQIPFLGVPMDYDPAVLSKTAASSRIPYFTYPETGEQFTGQPGETNMQHLVRVTGLSVPEILARYPDAGKLPAPVGPAT